MVLFESLTLFTLQQPISCQNVPHLLMSAEVRNQIIIRYGDGTSHKVDRRVIYMR